MSKKEFARDNERDRHLVTAIWAVKYALLMSNGMKSAAQASYNELSAIMGERRASEVRAFADLELAHRYPVP